MTGCQIHSHAPARRLREVTIPSEQRAYARAMEKLVRGVIAKEPDLSKQAAKIASDGVKAAIKKASQYSPEQWTVARLGEITRALDAEIKAMGGNLTAAAERQLAQFSAAGRASVLEPLSRAGVLDSSIVAQFPDVNPDLLRTMGGFTSDLIQQVTTETQEALSKAVKTSLLSGGSQFDAIQGIQAGLTKAYAAGDAGATALTFPSLFARAEAIFRTESLRMFSLAQQAAGAELVTTFPGTRKKWQAIEDSRTRDSHAELDEVEVPFDEPFVFEGQKGETVELMFPRDPAGPPEETIQCRCALLYVLGDDEDGEAPDDVTRADSGVSGLRADVDELADEILESIFHPEENR